MADGENNTRVPTLKKPVYTWTVPETARQFPTDPTSFSIEAWAIGVHIDALRVLAKTTTLPEYELFQRTCVRIDGKPVDQAQDLMGAWSPKVRQLAVDAVNRIAIPSKEESDSFLASETVSVE